MKQNIDWYKHESNSHHHWKFKMLRVLFQKEFNQDGFAGEGRFWALNNEIAKSKNCELDLSLEIKKLSIAADLSLTVEELDRFLHILVYGVKLVHISDQGFYFTEHTQTGLLSATSDRSRDRDRKGKNIPNPQKTAEKSKENQNSGAENQNSGAENDVSEGKIRRDKNRVEKNTEYIPETGVSVSKVSVVKTDEKKPSDFVQKKSGKKRPPAPGVEPFQEMFVFEFEAEWKKVRATEKHFNFQPKDFKSIKDLSKILRKDFTGEWTREVAREKFTDFMQKAKKDSFISKNNFENFTLPFFINRINSILSINENGQHKNTKGSPGRSIVFDKP